MRLYSSSSQSPPYPWRWRGIVLALLSILSAWVNPPLLHAQKMYWTDSSSSGKIQRANLDGSAVQDLVTTGVSIPNSIALDVAGGKMYWTDAGIGRIRRANLDGSAV